MFRPMFEFMKCIAEGIAAKGIGGLLEEVPYGNYVHGVGAYALKRWREKHAQHNLEEAVKESIGKKADEAIAEARKAVEEGAPQLTGREKELAVQLIAGMPEAVRQSLKRKDDPKGESLPYGYTIYEDGTSEEEAVAKVVELLPPHPPRFVPDEWVPGRVGNWKLVQKIGGGGFGDVWLTRSKRFAAPRVVKFCTDPAARRKFVAHEQDVIDRVMDSIGSHPNIVPLLECHLEGDAPWLMYEYVEGGTLADAILEWHALKPGERIARAVAVLHPIAAALARGHALTPPVVHRDLKPANVLMAGDTPRITDYGIGGVAVDYLIAADKSPAHVSMRGRLPSMLKGSYSHIYSSPQQRAGEKPDPRDDVHALGVIAYQMFVGRVDAEVKGNWQLRLRKDGVPDAIIDLIGNSASDEAEDRPNDAREWEAVLADLLPVAELADEPSPAPARTAPAPPARKGGDEVTFPLPHGGKMVFCWVPKGECQLGSPKAERDAVLKDIGQTEEPEWLQAEREGERGKFKTQGFWMGKYTVTQAEWKAVMRNNPSYFDGKQDNKAKGMDTSQFPVERVTWDMICGKDGKCGQDTFLGQMNALGGVEKVFGKGAGTFALPHEDQWEYACRGGLGNGRPFYFGDALNGTEAKCDGSCPFGTTTKGPDKGRPTPVGFYTAKPLLHPWGLFDMTGNVWEWCENKYDQTNDRRVLRGGSWISDARYCRAAIRYDDVAPGFDGYDVGFRLVVPGLP